MPEDATQLFYEHYSLSKSDRRQVELFCKRHGSLLYAGRANSPDVGSTGHHPKVYFSTEPVVLPIVTDLSLEALIDFEEKCIERKRPPFNKANNPDWAAQHERREALLGRRVERRKFTKSTLLSQRPAEWLVAFSLGALTVIGLWWILPVGLIAWGMVTLGVRSKKLR